MLHRKTTRSRSHFSAEQGVMSLRGKSNKKQTFNSIFNTPHLLRHLYNAVILRVTMKIKVLTSSVLIALSSSAYTDFTLLVVA